MFGSRRGGTVIAEGLKIMGSVTAEGLVEVNGQIEGELHCTSLIVSRKAQVAGTIVAERVVVDGRVEGPIQGGEVVLKSQARVVGDIHHQSLAIEKGAYFEGRSVQAHGANGHQPDRASKRMLREAANNSREADVGWAGRRWFQTVSPIEAMRFVGPIAQTTAVLFQRAGFSVRDIAQTHDSVVYGMNAHGPIEILGGERGEELLRARMSASGT